MLWQKSRLSAPRPWAGPKSRRLVPLANGPSPAERIATWAVDASKERRWRLQGAPAPSRWADGWMWMVDGPAGGPGGRLGAAPLELNIARQPPEISQAPPHLRLEKARPAQAIQLPRSGDKAQKSPQPAGRLYKRANRPGNSRQPSGAPKPRAPGAFFIGQALGAATGFALARLLRPAQRPRSRRRSPPWSGRRPRPGPRA